MPLLGLIRLLDMKIQASRRTRGVEYAIRDIVEEASELERCGKKVIYLNTGDPVRYGFQTPLHIRRALEKAVTNGFNYYSSSEGLKELREAIVEKEKRVNMVELDPANVIVTTGITEGILLLISAIVNPGDEVLMPGPCYPAYIAYTTFFEGKAVTYRTIEDRGWAPDLSNLEEKISERTRLILIINPSNPCGSVYSQDDLEKILELAASHDIPVAADEVYDRIIFDRNFTSVGSLAKEAPIIGLNGFSKTYLMTGWRLGYIYLHDPLGRLSKVWEGIQRLSRTRCASTPAQKAGVEALRGSEEHIFQMVSKLKKRRDFAWKRINQIPGLASSKPEGAFYIFPRVTMIEKWRNDEEFIIELLEKTGVLLVHGSGFDATYGKDHFRAVFLPEENLLAEAFDRIDEFMKMYA